MAKTYIVGDVHGHVEKLTADITQAYTYAGGLCTNVDGSLYKDGTGFLHELD